MNTNSNIKTALDMKRTSIKEKKQNLPNQTYKTKYSKLNKTYQTKPSKVTKAKPLNSIHKPNWQIQNMLVN